MLLGACSDGLHLLVCSEWIHPGSWACWHPGAWSVNGCVHVACKKSQTAASAPWWRDRPSRLSNHSLYSALLSPTTRNVISNYRQSTSFWLQQVLRSEALSHPHVARGVCSRCAVAEMHRAEPVSAGSGGDPAFPMSFWDEAVQQLAEREFPACESSTPKHRPCAQVSRCWAHQPWTRCTAGGVPLLMLPKLIHCLFDRTYWLSKPKDSLHYPSFKEAKEIIILSGLSCKGNMLSFFVILRKENKPRDCC